MLQKNKNQIQEIDKSFHNWYRFVLSFPPHLVNEYSEKFDLRPGMTVLDPFCGTGTTLVELKKHGIDSIGVEANKMAYFASQTKCNWEIDPTQLWEESRYIAEIASAKIASARKKRCLGDEQMAMLLKGSIDPEPLHRTLILLEVIHAYHSEFYNHQLLALATATVKYSSRLHFGPEVGVSSRKKVDEDVIASWLSMIQVFVDDLSALSNSSFGNTRVYHADARTEPVFLEKNSIDAVFTSPPYPNEKDYTRTTRLESVILGFINNKHELRDMKKGLLRSNTRNVYKDDGDDAYVQQFPEVLALAAQIEARRKELNKTSGFEKMYHRVTTLYFGGMARHLENLRPYLKKGARLGYVVGDQASFLRVHIATGNILAGIAKNLGYDVVSIDLFRTRFATATQNNLNEEVLVLQWNGGS